VSQSWAHAGLRSLPSQRGVLSASIGPVNSLSPGHLLLQEAMVRRRRGLNVPVCPK
jgi:hypothetical protein